MTQEYYIVTGKVRSGPYDMVALVRKIRNGNVTGKSQLQKDEASAPKAAEEWAELAEFFAEKKEEKGSGGDANGPKHSLGMMLKIGGRFLQHNQYSTVLSGVFILMVILAAAAVNFVLPPALHVISYLIFFVAGHLFLACFIFSLLRMARGQPVDIGYMQSKIVPAFRPLIMSSIFVCLPALTGLSLLMSSMPSAVLLVGLIIFAIPGLLFIAIYAYTPLLILDKGYDFWEGLEVSRKTILKNGLEFAGVIYALFVINFLGGLCALLPLVLTLPITMGALADTFDETFP